MDFDIIKKIISVIPPLSADAHKGQAGRIGVFGGSKNFTGAPYFAAISALRVGCDLSYVFCTKDASQVIKTYSPELMVHPILDSPNFTEEISTQLPVLHSIVIGPGLGRDKSVFNSIRSLISLAKEKNLPIVFDADSLFYLNTSFKEIAGYKKAILTPNKVEFSRLYSAVCKKDLNKEATKDDVQELSNLLGNITIVKKGSIDIISDGLHTVICNAPGSSRRCGGQGDLLAGSMGVFNFWATDSPKIENNFYNPTILAAMAACMLTRKCNCLAFMKFGRSTITSDMICEINEAFTSLFTH